MNDLGALVTGEVTRADADLQSFRSRALTIVSVSGGLVTLSTGFIALAAGSNKDVLPDSARWVVVAGLLCFISAAVSALVIKSWEEEGWDQQVAIVLTEDLIGLRNAQENAALWLSRAIKLEIGGIALTAVLAVTIVDHLD